MDGPRRPLDALSHFVHAHFLWLLLATYFVAGFLPGPGLAVRHLSLGDLPLPGGAVRLSTPVLMLAFLLFNAGLGVQPGQLPALWRRPLAPALGLAANLLVPIAYIGTVSLVLKRWHSPDEVQNILVGLALVAAMPIAGSSTAWAQNADGDLALSLGLVLGSTLLSPVTTPLALHAVGFMTTGDYAEDLHELADRGAEGFLVGTVLIPSALGVVARLCLGEARTAAVRPRLRLINSAILLALNYSNAAISLPEAVRHPDWDFLTAILGVTVGLCAAGFSAGWAVARFARVDAPRRTSLMFGLGMNNNGTGLVLASMTLADHPRVMLPIILFNLVQHLAAGVCNLFLRRPAGADDRSAEPPSPSPGRPAEPMALAAGRDPS